MCAKNETIDADFLGILFGIFQSYKVFCTSQYNLVFNKFGHTSLPFQEKSLLVGISCFSFMLPILFCQRENIWLWIFQSLISFASDYVYSGRYSITHGIDRVFAVSMTIYTAIWAILSFPLHLLFLVPVLLFCCTICIVKSKAAAKEKNRVAYEFYHCLWHFLAGPTGAFVIYMKNR